MLIQVIAQTLKRKGEKQATFKQADSVVDANACDVGLIERKSERAEVRALAHILNLEEIAPRAKVVVEGCSRAPSGCATERRRKCKVWIDRNETAKPFIAARESL